MNETSYEEVGGNIFNKIHHGKRTVINISPDVIKTNAWDRILMNNEKLYQDGVKGAHKSGHT